MNPVGTVADFVARLRNRFPVGWAGSATKAPIFAALILGMATAHANFYALAQFAGQMIYVQSASGGWLDTWAYDFFGPYLLRNFGESGTSFLSRIKSLLFASTCTRDAVTGIVTKLTGVDPTLVEPWRGPDTFALGVDTFALGVAGEGRLGSTDMPFQAFLFIPSVASNVGGMALDVNGMALDVSSSGNYLNDNASGLTSQKDVMNAVNLVRPIGVTVWADFTNSKTFAGVR